MSAVKDGARRAVEARSDDLITLGGKILRRPELGYKEFETSALIAESSRTLALT